MMFHDVLGAEAYSQGPSRYQAFLDMSRLLQGNQAILLARAAERDGLELDRRRRDRSPATRIAAGCTIGL